MATTSYLKTTDQAIIKQYDHMIAQREKYMKDLDAFLKELFPDTEMPTARLRDGWGCMTLLGVERDEKPKGFKDGPHGSFEPRKDNPIRQAWDAFSIKLDQVGGVPWIHVNDEARLLSPGFLQAGDALYASWQRAINTEGVDFKDLSDAWVPAKASEYHLALESVEEPAA